MKKHQSKTDSSPDPRYAGLSPMWADMLKKQADMHPEAVARAERAEAERAAIRLGQTEPDFG